MPAKPIVYLNLQDNGEIVLQLTTEHGLQPLDASPEQPLGQEWLVAIPPFWGALHRVALPTRDYQKANAAVGYALEERLSDDFSTRQFVLGAKADSQQCWQVLVLARERVEMIRALLREHAIDHAQLQHPLSLWPRPPAGQWYVYLASDQTRWDVVDTHGGGFSLPYSGFESALKAVDSFAQTATVEQVFWSVPDWDAPTQPLGVHHAPIPHVDERAWQPLQTRTTPALAMQISPQAQTQRRWKQRAFLGVAVMLLALLLYPSLQLWDQQRNLAMLEEQIAQDFATALPDSRMVNPAVQVRPLLEQDHEQASALAQFAQLSGQLQAAELAEAVVGLEYQKPDWQWQFAEGRADAVQEWLALLQQSGYQARLQQQQPPIVAVSLEVR